MPSLCLFMLSLASFSLRWASMVDGMAARRSFAAPCGLQIFPFAGLSGRLRAPGRGGGAAGGCFAVLAPWSRCKELVGLLACPAATLCGSSSVISDEAGLLLRSAAPPRLASSCRISSWAP